MAVMKKKLTTTVICEINRLKNFEVYVPPRTQGGRVGRKEKKSNKKKYLIPA